MPPAGCHVATAEVNVRVGRWVSCATSWLSCGDGRSQRVSWSVGVVCQETIPITCGPFINQTVLFQCTTRMTIRNSPHSSHVHQHPGLKRSLSITISPYVVRIKTTRKNGGKREMDFLFFLNIRIIVVLHKVFCYRGIAFLTSNTCTIYS